MSCERYQRLLHLNRAGEISTHEADELRRHLRLCEKCSIELQRIERADGFIDRLGAFSPASTNPEKLTADILRRVRTDSAISKPLSLSDRIFDFFLLPGVRYSSVAVVLLITFTFMTQGLATLNSISVLEQRVSSHLRQATTEATYSMESKTLQEVAKSERGVSLAQNISFTVTKNRIHVPAREVDAFLSDHAVGNLSTVVGASVLGIDKKTFEKIVNEVKATVESTFRIRHEGA